MPLVLRRTESLDRPATTNRPPAWGPDDYCVLAGNGVIGRIYRCRSLPAGGPQWIWAMGFEHVAKGARQQGLAGTRDEAMAAFRASYTGPE
jgi:hypothetical protein